jgi:AcrR family transcriptional regulator
LADSAEEPGRRRRRSQAEIMGRILQAAGEEFKRCGFAEATTAAIARKAEVTEAQIFRYFPSKAALFKEAVFNPVDQQLAAFVQTYLPEQVGAPYTTALQGFIRENIDLLTSLVVVQTYENGAAKGVAHVDGLNRYFERGASILAPLYSKTPKVDPKLMVRVSFAAVLGCIMFEDWIFPKGLATQEEITRAINDFVLAGLETDLTEQWSG